MSVVDRLKNAIKCSVPDPLLVQILPQATRWYAKVMTWYTCGRHHKAPIDPTKIIWIDPTTVTFRMTGKSKSCTNYSDMICEVLEGSWDKNVSELSNYDLYNGLVDRFENDVAWESTDFYKNRVESIQSGKKKWGCDNIKQFKNRLSELDDLYRNIGSEGYYTQKKIKNKRMSKPAHNRSNKYLYPEFHEVIVNIDRNGKFILHEGRHRFTIARVLGLKYIPVRIKVRHKKWQQIRDDAISSPELLVTHTDHPDIHTRVN